MAPSVVDKYRGPDHNSLELVDRSSIDCNKGFHRKAKKQLQGIAAEAVAAAVAAVVAAAAELS